MELQALVDRYADATVDWAKIHKHTEKKLRSIERRQKEEAERQSFRRNPPDGEIFPCQVSLAYPQHYPTNMADRCSSGHLHVAPQSLSCHSTSW